MRTNSTYKELLSYVAELESKISALEQKLEENREKTEKLKSRFLGNVSHELRTPMNAILGFSNLLIDKNIPHDKREEYMEHINQSSTNLLRIVDAMIDVSLLEINELRIHKEYCNLEKLVQQVYYFFNIDKHKIGKDNIVLLMNRDRKLSEMMLYTDPYRLTQVLSSLLSNAFKFTNKGIIEFGYFLRDETSLQFYVKDSGRGISIERAHAIFEKFEKLEEDYGNAEGVGLGLALAKGIIDLLGGEIWAEKNMVRGSTFNFTISIMQTEKKTAHAEPSYSKILVK
jgi:signal transduction histidine kinase